MIYFLSFLTQFYTLPYKSYELWSIVCSSILFMFLCALWNWTTNIILISFFVPLNLRWPSACVCTHTVFLCVFSPASLLVNYCSSESEVFIVSDVQPVECILIFEIESQTCLPVNTSVASVSCAFLSTRSTIHIPLNLLLTFKSLEIQAYKSASCWLLLLITSMQNIRTSEHVLMINSLVKS